MRFSLSTNWCNRTLASGEEIADKALALGFDELELGFHTAASQVPGFRARLDRIPVGSIHAFCPVPVSAPQGHPELYSLASLDEDARGLARFHVRKNIEFAAEMGAETVVLHAGRVPFSGFLNRGLSSETLRRRLAEAKGDVTDRRYARLLAKALKVRRARGLRLLETFKAELARLVPILERHRVVLALENLPYLEGFPDESEMGLLADAFRGAPIKAWFDTGHHRVRQMHNWLATRDFTACANAREQSLFRGLHLNDVVDYTDDHLPPGEGKVDFAALKELAQSVRHIVLEPNGGVGEDALAKGLAYVRGLWRPQDQSFAPGTISSGCES